MQYHFWGDKETELILATLHNINIMTIIELNSALQYVNISGKNNHNSQRIVRIMHINGSDEVCLCLNANNYSDYWK